MKKLFKPACLLFNILTLLLFFFLGLLYAGWMEAGKNQGLAGGAIVLGYGVLFAMVALIISFFVTYRSEHKHIVRANVVLALLILASFLFVKNKADTRRKERKERDEIESQQTTKLINQNALFALLKIVPLPSNYSKKDKGWMVWKRRPTPNM